MDAAEVSPALQERLGVEATDGLIELFDIARQEWTAEVTTAAVERFERRLGDESHHLRSEIAALRLEMNGGFAQLRQEMTNRLAEVRQEMTTGFAEVRQEMTNRFAEVRQEMTTGFAEVRQEMALGFAKQREEIARDRVDLVKWCFLFWVGQFFAVAGVMAVVIRLLGP